MTNRELEATFERMRLCHLSPWIFLQLYQTLVIEKCVFGGWSVKSWWVWHLNGGETFSFFGQPHFTIAVLELFHPLPSFPQVPLSSSECFTNPSTHNHAFIAIPGLYYQFWHVALFLVSDSLVCRDCLSHVQQEVLLNPLFILCWVGGFFKVSCSLYVKAGAFLSLPFVLDVTGFFGAPCAF